MRKRYGGRASVADKQRTEHEQDDATDDRKREPPSR
jgi:hypothetical protein